MICTSCQILFKLEKNNWVGIVWGRGEVHTRVLVGKPDVKRQFGRPGPRWEDNIKVNFQYKGWG